MSVGQMEEEFKDGKLNRPDLIALLAGKDEEEIQESEFSEDIKKEAIKLREKIEADGMMRMM